jgi:hypothetical protein
MENISRGGFCHYLYRGVDAGRHTCKTTEYKSTDVSPPPPTFKCMRESLSVDSQNISCATLKRRGSSRGQSLYVSDSGVPTGQGALAGAAVLGLGGLAFYGLGLGRELGAVDRQVAWPQYVKVGSLQGCGSALS